jgi:hypothetical protein
MCMDEGDMGDDSEELDNRVREEVVAFLDHRDDVRGDVSRRDEERAAAQKLRYDSKLRGTREFLHNGICNPKQKDGT